jgi:uncharacterized RDD family membrane protein YckC
MTTPTPDAAGNIAAGYYHAEGDPPETVRYWDGTQWTGNPMPPPPGVAGAQGPAVDTRFAGTGVRIGAVLIDGLLMFIIGAIIAFPSITDAIDEANQSDGTFEYTTGAESFIAPLIFLAIVITMTATLGGTPGKLMLGLRITTSDGTTTPPGFGPATLRTLPWLPTLIPLLGVLIWIGIAIAGIVMISNDSERRSPFDRAGGTRVIRTR